MGSSPAPYVKQSKFAPQQLHNSGFPQTCWQFRAWHFLLAVAAALLLIFISVPHSNGREVLTWGRGLRPRRSHGQICNSSTAPDVYVAPGQGAAVAASTAAAADQSASLPPLLEQESQGRYELLYSQKGSSPQAQHTCPFDFSQPLPADSAGQPLTYTECLAQHGRSLDEGYDFRWLRRAVTAGTAPRRRAHLVAHVRDMWLWSLSRGVGTPCRPMIVTFVCRDDGHVCGGLGDRVRGQSLAFWQAVLTHSFFVSQWERPVAVQEYLLPADDALAFPHVRACLAAPVNTSASVATWRALQVFSAAKLRDFDYVNEWRGADMVESRGNAALFPEFLQSPALAPAAARYRLTGVPVRDLLHASLALYLSRPSPYLAETIEPYLAQLAESAGALRVGVHVRVGGAKLGDPVRQPLESVGCMAEEVAAQCADAAPRPCVAFLAADSAEALAAVAERLREAGVGVVTARGTITHNDKPHLAALPAGNATALVEAAAKTYVDWYLLTQMDALVMSRSGFSFAAAWAAMPERARWMDLAAARAGRCHFLDFPSRCRGARCPGVGRAFARGSETDDLGWHGNFTIAAPASAADEAAEAPVAASSGGSSGGSRSSSGKARGRKQGPDGTDRRDGSSGDGSGDSSGGHGQTGSAGGGTLEQQWRGKGAADSSGEPDLRHRTFL